MVYLDNAATTALDPDILKAMQLYFSEQFGNASSVHAYGREARMAIERARQVAADVLHAEAKEIIFTSSASEANNLAIKGVIECILENFSLRSKSKTALLFELEKREPLLEIVASPIEHPCVMESLRHVEKLGWAKINWLPVNSVGKVSVEAVESAITDKTVLVCMMYVNNEIGTVQPIAEIGALVKKVRKQRVSENALPIYFHTDAVQAVQYFDCDVQKLGVDLLSLTGHKLYGPKGTGLLYVRDGIALTRQMDGGGQEYYKRAGTENVAGIVGMAAALQTYAWNPERSFQSLEMLQQRLIEQVCSQIPDCQLTGSADLRAPHITSFIFENVDPEALIIALDRDGFAVSSGSACSSGVVRQSHVIEALHLPIAKKSAAVRISTGKNTTNEEIDAFIVALKKNVALLREMQI